jgi:hypothetical protein
MVLTRGDTLGKRAEAGGLARTVAPGDAPGVAEALLALIAEPGGRAAFAERARALADDMRWSKVVVPLLEFCRRPRLAADRAAAPVRPGLTPALVAKVWRRLRTRGLGGLLHDVRVYLSAR